MDFGIFMDFYSTRGLTQNEVFKEAFDLVDNADALMVLGSSLTVMSGLRFVRRAAKASIPIVIVNRGATRGDQFASAISHDGCSETLTALVDALPSIHRE